MNLFLFSRQDAKAQRENGMDGCRRTEDGRAEEGVRFEERRWAELWLTNSVHELVIGLVRANPKPDNAFIFTPRDGPVTQTDINGPDIAFLGKA